MTDTQPVARLVDGEVSVGLFVGFARQQDAEKAALVAALKHQVARTHPHDPERCDGCEDAIDALGQGGAGMTDELQDERETVIQACYEWSIAEDDTDEDVRSRDAREAALTALIEKAKLVGRLEEAADSRDAASDQPEIVFVYCAKRVLDAEAALAATGKEVTG